LLETVADFPNETAALDLVALEGLEIHRPAIFDVSRFSVSG
jgi:hypothetical protein